MHKLVTRYVTVYVSSVGYVWERLSDPNTALERIIRPLGLAAPHSGHVRGLHGDDNGRVLGSASPSCARSALHPGRTPAAPPAPVHRQSPAAELRDLRVRLRELGH